MKLKEIVSFKFSLVPVLSWVAFYPKVINKLANLNDVSLTVAVVIR